MPRRGSNSHLRPGCGHAGSDFSSWVSGPVRSRAAKDLTAGALTLIEKKLPPPWDILIHAWFDLSSDLPPAVMRREFFGDDGGFRAGPTDPELFLCAPHALYAVNRDVEFRACKTTFELADTTVTANHWSRRNSA